MAAFVWSLLTLIIELQRLNLNQLNNLKWSSLEKYLTTEAINYFAKRFIYIAIFRNYRLFHKYNYIVKVCGFVYEECLTKLPEILKR